MPTRRSRHDRDSASGLTPGAESFARPDGQRQPQGIVLLSDLVAGLDDTSDVDDAASRRRIGHGNPGSQPERSEGFASARTRRRSNRLGSTANDARFDDQRDRSREAHSSLPIASDRSAGVDRHTDVGDPPPVDPGDGPQYESLFGADADTTRRPRRERKPITPVQRAIGLLSRREHSRKELGRKLLAKGVEPADAEQAVAKLSDMGWQDERRFADSLVRSRASAGYGPLHIRAELGTHDLAAEVRQAALDAFDGDWTEIARDLVTRRFARIDDPRQRARKAGDYLMRRGFPVDIVRAVSRFEVDEG